MTFADSYILADIINGILATLFAIGIIFFPNKKYRYLLKPYRPLFVLAALWILNNDGIRKFVNVLTHQGLLSADALAWFAWSGVFVGCVALGFFIPYLRNFGLLNRLEKLRAESEAKYYALFDYSPLAMIQVNQNSEIQDWNKSAERVFGYNKQEMLDKNTGIIFPHRDKLCGNSAIKERIERGDSLIGRRIPTEGKRKDGSLFPVELSISMFNVSHSKHFNVIIVDLTK